MKTRYALELCDIEKNGFALVDGVSNSEELLKLASTIGVPLANERGALVQKLTPIAKSDAQRDGLSARYGKDAFPLHTDTAFWTTPARYLVMRCIGDTRRSTTITTFEEMMREWSPSLLAARDRSIWVVQRQHASFFCGFRFRVDGAVGYRFDRNCMIPRNSAALAIANAMKSSSAIESKSQAIRWRRGRAVVIANWTALHGRDASPANERHRVVERIYVR